MRGWTASVLVLAAAVAGCGGDGDDGEAASAAARAQPVEQFRAKADAICETVSAQLAETMLPHSFPADMEEFDRKSKRVLAVIEEPFGELAALDPPEGQEAVFARFSAALQGAVAEARQLRTLIEEGNDDTDALWLPRTNIETRHAQAMNQAVELGLERCDELDYKEASH